MPPIVPYGRLLTVLIIDHRSERGGGGSGGVSGADDQFPAAGADPAGSGQTTPYRDKVHAQICAPRRAGRWAAVR
jgi:hypothetical protein